MKILDRHISASVLVAALYGVFVLSFVLVLGNVFKEAMDLLINRGVPLSYLLFFMACVLPFSLTYTVPWAFLTAVLLVFGRMSADHETLAWRACGTSLLRLAVPVLGLAVAISMLMLWINIAVAPRAEMAMRRSLATMASSNPTALFVPGEVIDAVRGRKIFIGGRDGETLLDITVIEQDEAALPKAVLRAERGVVRRNEATAELELSLDRVLLENRPEGAGGDLGRIRHGILAGHAVVPIPLDDLVATKLLWRPLRTFPLAELWQFLGEDLESREWPRRSAVRTEISKRFSLGFATLAFALLAIPLGIVAHRRETSAGFVLSLVVALGYFMFVAVADMLQANAAAQPHLLLWVPNLIFAAGGLWLLLRLDQT
jgi:lipopolysaccharide export system permease protein